MTADRSFVERNRVSTNRIRDLATRLSEAELQHRIGEHWTVAITLTHLAFWDLRVMLVLDDMEQNGKVSVMDVDDVVNDISLPFWTVIPPLEAARLAMECCTACDHRLETYPRTLLEQIDALNPAWIERYLHRNAHLDEIDAALKG